MSWLKSIIAAGVLQSAVLISGHAFADAALDRIKAEGVLKIGTEGTYAPFTYHDKDGKLVGFDVEIGQEIAKRLGVEAKFLEGKWDGLIAGLDANRYDAVINQVGITPERQKKYNFSEPYIASKAVLIVKTGNNDIKSFKDLKGRKSAQSLSSNYGKIAREYGAEIVANDGFDQSVQLVLSGRAEATVNASLSFLDFKKQKPDVPLVIVAELEDADKSGVLLRKGEDDLLAAVNKALEEIKSDGTYAKLSEKYFGADVSK
ncbi:amino acid ABC transporter substrate-binding protein [Pseudochrobactrum sp. HB0163]|uniref:amino acid ABC transporter substrate-binding protein n=1 Tax=Pseudochrobactrum sp. HB0163 TaxID=3450708 RepID=UPI003F6E119F